MELAWPGGAAAAAAARPGHPGQSPAGQGRPCGRLSRAGRGGSLLKNNTPCPSYSESSSTPGNGATPEEFPALADSPTTLTEALQMIHPIPADSWRNLIEQIGGCLRRRRGVTGGNRRAPGGLRVPCSWNAVAFHLGRTHLTRKVINIFGANGSMQNCRLLLVSCITGLEQMCSFPAPLDR